MISSTVAPIDITELLLSSLSQYALTSVTDPKGKISFANDLFCKTSGYSRKQLVGKSHRILKSDFHSAEFFQALWATILSGKYWHGDICYRKKSGERYWVNSTIIPVSREQGDPHFLSIMFDVTGTKESVSEKASAEKRQALQRLCTHLSHEINNPLTILDGSLKLMSRHLQDAEKLKSLLGIANKGSQRIIKVSTTSGPAENF